MSKKIITIEIDAAGNSTLDLAGYKGKGCAQVAKDFRGNDRLQSSTSKPEYNVQETKLQQQQSGK